MSFPEFEYNNGDINNGLDIIMVWFGYNMDIIMAL